MHGLQELARLVDRHAGEGPSETAIPNLNIYRGSTTRVPLAAMDDPTWCLPALGVVVQGRKRAVVGSQSHVFGAGSYLIAALGLPIVNAVFETAGSRPFLGLRLRIDLALLNEILIALPAEAVGEAPTPAGAPTVLPDELTDSLVRLLRLLDDPSDTMILARHMEREITYRLLRGAQGAQLRRIVHADSRMSQIRLAIEWLRHHYAERRRIEDVASIARMSPSSFYQHFKAVTSVSPLQFRKRLRLAEARRLIWTDHLDAATAGFKVGYESASQFSREYKMLFGEPPGRDASASSSGASAGGPAEAQVSLFRRRADLPPRPAAPGVDDVPNLAASARKVAAQPLRYTARV